MMDDDGDGAEIYPDSSCESGCLFIVVVSLSSSLCDWNVGKKVTSGPAILWHWHTASFALIAVDKIEKETLLSLTPQ